MKARLDDGTIIELTKDCGCITHDGPHWLHMDRLVHEMNRGGQLAAYAFTKEEIARLDEKRWEMKRRKIVEILEIGEQR